MATTTDRIRFAERVTTIAPSPTLAAMNRANEMVARGIDIVDLAPGEPDFQTPREVAEAGKRAIDEGRTKYTSVLGIPELRRAVADSYNSRYSSGIQPANVIAGTGGKQELFNLMLALVSPGDEVIIPAPYWVSFPDQVVFAGGRPVYAQTDPEDHFRPTLRDIKAVVSDKTRGLILNSPNNPTGAVIRETELRSIVEFCHAQDIFLVFDETYEFFVYDGQKHASPAKWFNEYPETLILVNSVSKTFAMTGWRLGFAIAHPNIIEMLAKIQSHSTSNPSSISQYAGVAALRSGGGEVKKMFDAYSERRSWMVDALNEVPGFECQPPDGAFYMFPRVSKLYERRGIKGSNAFADYLLNTAHVAVVPGEAFGNDEHVRISYATSLDRLKEGVARIRRAVDQLLS
jgi:aspartate aminotransferase